MLFKLFFLISTTLWRNEGYKEVSTVSVPFFSSQYFWRKGGRDHRCIFKWQRHLMVFKKMVLLIWAKRNMTSLPRDATMNTHEEVK